MRAIKIELTEDELVDIINFLWRVHNEYQIEPLRNPRLFTQEEKLVYEKKRKRCMKLISRISTQCIKQGLSLRGIN